MTIQTIDSISFVPVSVSYYQGSNPEPQFREELQAKLFEEFQGDHLTVIFANMAGDPVKEIARLVTASVKPRPAGGKSPWQIEIWLRQKGKRHSVGIPRDFPTDPLIVMQGEHDLNFSNLLPPISARSGLRWHCDSYAKAWQSIASYCGSIAKPEQLLLDTTEASIRWQRQRWPQDRIAISQQQQ